MLPIQRYLADPCGASSLPYWKLKEIVIPERMKIVHDRDYDALMFPDDEDEPYFRLFHDLKTIGAHTAQDVEIIAAPHAINEFVNLINASYQDVRVTAEQLAHDQQTIAFRPDLWVLMKEKETGKVLAGGIAAYDREAHELSLEWIQVLPPYRRRGYGQLIVNHLLQAMQGEARFATVSGQVNNPFCPEAFYRKCGFSGCDVWHILMIK